MFNVIERERKEGKFAELNIVERNLVWGDTRNSSMFHYTLPQGQMLRVLLAAEKMSVRGAKKVRRNEDGAFLDDLVLGFSNVFESLRASRSYRKNEYFLKTWGTTSHTHSTFFLRAPFVERDMKKSYFFSKAKYEGDTGGCCSR